MAMPRESVASVGRVVRGDWPQIVAAAVGRGLDPAMCAWCRVPSDPGKVRLLGSNLKVEKGEGKGVLTAIMHLLPGNVSGRELCPWRTRECSALCLGLGAGQLTMTPSRNAQAWRTVLCFGARPLFLRLLRAELAAHENRARRAGLEPAARLDGTSDLGLATRLAPEFPGVMFYDYSKSAKRALSAALGGIAPNYHCTLSFTGSNKADALRVLQAGGNVAVVFASRPGIKGSRDPEPIPAMLWGYPVIDGDVTDIRYGDPAGAVVGLRFKASSDWSRKVRAAGSFVVRPRGRELQLA